MPRPSAGCQTCSNRRIKCDETKPTCQKCAKSRRVCVQKVARQSQYSIHSENHYASGKTKRPRGPRSAAALKPELPLGNKYAILPSLNIDLETRALGLYLHGHLQTPTGMPGIARSFSDCLGDRIFETKQPSPMIEVGVSSMALAIYSQSYRHHGAAIEASVKYQQLLKLAQVLLPQLDETNIDGCLLAVFIMSRYEASTGYMVGPDAAFSSPSGSSTRSYSHHDGGMAILKVWRHCPDRRRLPATESIKFTRRGMIKSAILRNLPLPGWIVDGGPFGEQGLELDYDGLIVRMVNLRPRVSFLLRQEGDTTSPQLTSLAQELDQEAQDIDQALERWTSQVPSAWHYDQHTLADSPHPWPKRHVYSRKAYSYSSPAYAHLWNHYFAMRMLLNSTRLKILQSLLRFPTDDTAVIKQQEQECLSQIEVMACSLASSIPYCLQRLRIKEEGQDAPSDPSPARQKCSLTLSDAEEISPYMASLVMWPLTIAAGLDQGLNAELQAWLRSELVSLGRVIGATVFEYANTSHWIRV